MISNILSIISERGEKQASEIKAAKRRDVIEFT